MTLDSCLSSHGWAKNNSKTHQNLINYPLPLRPILIEG
jgi:hypothetical protein